MGNEIINYKPLEWEEIVLSGAFARKIYHSYLKQLNENPYCNINYNNKELILKGNSNILKQIAYNITLLVNNYLQNIISKVENEEFREKIMQFSHNEYSRNSLFHILNIELLCFSANKKPERFQIILDCVTDLFILTHDIKHYPFYLFAILDTEDLEIANDIYINLKKNPMLDIYCYVEEKLSVKEIKLIIKNIKELHLI